MRRSICFCEPGSALAGEERSWKFIYTPSASLPKGTLLKFDLQTKGRHIDWQVPEVDLSRSTSNVIFAQIEGGKPFAARLVTTTNALAPQFEFLLPIKVEAGKKIIITLGRTLTGKKKGGGNVAQTYVQRRRPFLLYVDPTGKGHYQEPEVFSLDIRGNRLTTIRVLAPSFVTKNKRFDVVVRFEDAFGNLTNNTDEETLVELSYENLRENLNWKLFIPETGFISLPNLYFNEAGIYTIRLQNMKTKELFCSAPIKCFSENAFHLFWGLLHGESEKIDSTENIESCLRHFRDDKAMNFFASSHFENMEETPAELWKLISQNIADFNEDDRFTSLLGFQWQGSSPSEGLRHLIYAKDNKPILRKKEVKSNTLNKMYNSATAKEFLSIPCFTMGQGYGYDFKHFNPAFERVVEIYNAWGSSECLSKEGNPFPICPEGKKGIKEAAEGSIQKALRSNCRFGFVAGGLDDRGIYSDFFESDQRQYPPGLTAIIAEQHTRESLLEALYNRSCYATTGEKIIIGLSLAGVSMGGELSTEQKPGLIVNRHLSGYVAGTAKLKSVEIIRNGEVIKKLTSNQYFLDFSYDDLIPLDKVVLAPQNKKQLPFAYYYLRVTQEDGHMAWSSPIWVDYVAHVKLKSTRRSKVTPSPQELEEEVEEENEDEDEE